MSESKTVQIEYCGPVNQDWEDEWGQKHQLVAGRRYQMTEEFGSYQVERNSSHWKRPNAPKAPAAKE